MSHENMNDFINSAICIRHMKLNWNEMWVRDNFSKFGTIVNINLPIHRDGQKKGFGIVEFAKFEEAHNAANEMSIFIF